ncbi:hypothetical protein Pcinc_012682 [Petrolisthes cinctipes]|uniref:Uncharacterized protein n=1 Tax=Petrolisthes cinctipes TaxID=88211 RepID=A0AAE1FYU9_PETCI|nr:hypothetical protein Pcinc_018296 [Petrolisthes cinctipes]KAK3882960.1 hypothetical protein Pcinc_012682 [Petrolisthes cinctipes]
MPGKTKTNQMTVDKLTLLHLKNLCLMLVKMEVELTYTAVYVQQSSFIEDVPEPHPHADFYALHQEPVAEITISEIGGGVDLHNSLQEFSVAEVTPVPHPDHTYLCTSQDGADFGQPADVGIQIGQPTLDVETQTLDMVCLSMPVKPRRTKSFTNQSRRNFLGVTSRPLARHVTQSRAWIKLTDYLAAYVGTAASLSASSIPARLVARYPTSELQYGE